MRRITDFAVFVAVVKAGTISEATKELGLSVASVSKYISRVESEIGVRLLVRSSRGLRLTEEGQALYNDLEGLLLRVNQVISHAADSKTEPRGVLRINATIALGRHRIAPLVSRFSAQYPQLSVQLYLGDRLVDMSRDDMDVLITIGEPVDTSLIAKRLMRNPSLLCASRAYLDKHGTPESLDDLKRHECLVLDCHRSYGDHWKLMDDNGNEHEVAVTGSLVTDNSETLREWILKGYGIALKSRWDIEPYLQSGELVHVLPHLRGPEMDFHVAYPSRQLPAKTRAFVEFVRRNIDASPLQDDPEGPPDGHQ